MKLIVGLGNPGKEYEGTRHNLGFEVVERLGELWKAEWKLDKGKCLVGKVKKREEEVWLVKPQEYMNNSGEGVRQLLKFYKLNQATEVWVIHDDIDLELGRLKIQIGGGAAGHHGVESMLNQLKGIDVVRFRMGVGRPQGEGADWVLGRFSQEEEKVAEEMIGRTVKAVEWAVKEGAERAMNEFNG